MNSLTQRIKGFAGLVVLALTLASVAPPARWAVIDAEAQAASALQAGGGADQCMTASKSARADAVDFTAARFASSDASGQAAEQEAPA